MQRHHYHHASHHQLTRDQLTSSMEVEDVVEEEMAEAVGEEARRMAVAVVGQDLEPDHQPPAECHMPLEQPRTSM